MWKTLKQTFNSTDSYISLALGFAVVVAVGMLVFNFIQSTQEAQQKEKEEEKRAEEAQAPLTVPAEHTVKKGETLWSIAETYYQSGYNWVDIAEANNLSDADSIEADQKLTIPDVEVKKQTAGEVSSVSTAKEYTVKKGDTLWNIAVEAYGSGYKWIDIARANNLSNPDIIHSGNTLTLP